MKIVYIVNARLPNKKAYGIQVAKMCEAFVEAEIDLELVIPRTHASSIATLKDAYKLRVDIPTTILPGLDLYASGRIPFFISSCVFIITSSIYLLWKRMRGEGCIVYTIDMDTFSFSLLPLLGFPVVAEMHDIKPCNIFTRFFFKHVKLLVVTNTQIRDALCDRFDISSDKTIIEPNGVDLDLFAHASSQGEVRKRLHIPQDKKIALYVGRFYEWKGLDILVDAAKQAPALDWYVVGDTTEVFTKVTGRTSLPANLHIAGECEPSDVPLWLAAADTLLILGTKHNDQSYRHTAPMKVYEYMAARRPIVASHTPALTSIIGESDAIWYEPDDAESLARATERAITEPNPNTMERNLRSAQAHSWAARVDRITSLF
ncbi:glycosyltransferase family 4 protein [Candidatus Kaiserbacteria bacterium]|nr:glycosyltransferase family 4 protein [Candidatus Kaiserbacteria bacterium]